MDIYKILLGIILVSVLGLICIVSPTIGFALVGLLVVIIAVIRSYTRLVKVLLILSGLIMISGSVLTILDKGSLSIYGIIVFLTGFIIILPIALLMDNREPVL
jgi:hypothetical protein